MTFNWSALIPLLLKAVVWLIKNKLDDRQQRELGRNEAVQEATVLLNTRVQLAKLVDEDSEHWSDDDVDSILRGNPAPDKRGE